MMSAVISPINQATSSPVTDWSQHARQAMIWLQPNSVKTFARKSESTKLTTVTLARSVFDLAVEKIKRAYFVGFQNVASSIRTLSPNIDIGETARALQLSVTLQIGSLLSKDRGWIGRLVRTKPGQAIDTTARTRQQQDNVKPHFHVHGQTRANAQIESLGYPPPTEGKLTFYNVRDSMWKNNIAELFDGVNNRPKAENEASLESFTPQGQELDDYHFYVFIDGAKVLLHGVSGISLLNQRYIQHIELIPVMRPQSDFRGWKRSEREALLRFINRQIS